MPRLNIGPGINSAIQEGLLAFARARSEGEDRDLRRQELEAQREERRGLLQDRERKQRFEEAQAGLLRDEATGTYSLDSSYVARRADEAAQKAKQQRELELLKDGYQPEYDASGRITRVKTLPGFLRKKDASETRIDPFLKPQLDNANTTLAKRAGGVEKLQALLTQLQDPTKTEAEKIAIGEGGYKLLNDPENPDVVGAEEAKRIGKYLQPGFHPFRPGSKWFGRDLEAFTQQVRNKLEQAQSTKDLAETKLRQLSGRSGARDSAGLLQQERVVNGVRYRKVKGGWEAIDG